MTHVLRRSSEVVHLRQKLTVVGVVYLDVVVVVYGVGVLVGVIYEVMQVTDGVVVTVG